MALPADQREALRVLAGSNGCAESLLRASKTALSVKIKICSGWPWHRRNLEIRLLAPCYRNSVTIRAAVGGCRGFKEDWTKVTEKDAADFLLGLDAGLIEHRGRGLYKAPRSLASEQFFWSGRKGVSPRPVTLWVEPIITVAVLYRLHREFGWPSNLLGTQTEKWEFDVAAYRASDLTNEHVACEIKKTSAERDQLVELMQQLAADPNRCSTSSHRGNVMLYAS